MCFFQLSVKAYASSVSKTKASKLNYSSLSPLLRYLQLPALLLYIIQVSKFQTGSLVSLFFCLVHFVYIPLVEVFLEENAFFFPSPELVLVVVFTFHLVTWIGWNCHLGFFAKLQLCVYMCLFCFWLHLVWLLRKWWKINATKKLVEDFEYWGFHWCLPLKHFSSSAKKYK